MGSEQKAAQKIKSMIDKNDVAMLVTHDEHGGLVSRPMTIQEQEFDGDLWFFVSQDSDVISEIKANASVNVAYSGDGDYVSLSGSGLIINDLEKKKQLWRPELKYWFDGKGPEAPEVTLIKVDVSSARYWDGMSNVVEKAVSVAKSLFTNDTSSIGSGRANY